MKTQTYYRGAALAAVAAVVLAGSLALTSGSPAVAHDDLVACADLPLKWSGATEINYDSNTHTVLFVWGDGQHAEIADTEPECPSQAGLGAALREQREGVASSELAACKDLRGLVNAVRAERTANGQSLHGQVPVSDQAEAAHARATGVPPAAAIAKRRAVGQGIDLDQADAVLVQCPE
jgi:hypothetical protein